MMPLESSAFSTTETVLVVLLAESGAAATKSGAVKSGAAQIGAT